MFTNLVITNMSVAHRLTALERKTAIVDAAIKLFSEKGFRGTTTRELAAAVGVSEPVLYQHFQTKSDLYSAIIETKSQDVQRFTGELEAYLSGDDDRGFFSFLANLILDFYEKDPTYLRLLLFSALERHELKDRFHERQARGAMQAISGYIDRRVQQGAFRSIDPMLVALSFMGMVAHYGQDRLFAERSEWPANRQDVVDGMVNIFLDGIRVKS